jgi:hypothetical protein
VPISIDAKLASKLRATEPHIFDALKAGGEHQRAEDWVIVPPDETRTPPRPAYAFKIHNLWDPEYKALAKKHTRRERDPDTGLDTGVVDFDQARYQSECIHEATDPEDRAVLWDNQDMRRSYGINSNIDVIEPMLGGPGIKAAVIAAIDVLGRYGVGLLSQEDAEKLLGNSSAPEGAAPSFTVSTNAATDD